MPKTADLMVMDGDELELRLAESRTELLNLRFQMATGQLDNTSRLGHIRREIARILTVMRDREIAEAEGNFVPMATLGAAAERIRDMDKATAAEEHHGEQAYEDLVAEDEALVTALTPKKRSKAETAETADTADSADAPTSADASDSADAPETAAAADEATPGRTRRRRRSKEETDG